MSGDGESKEGIAVVPFVELICIPTDSFRLPHQSVKCRIRLMKVDTAVRVITTIMPADGVNTSPNTVNIVVEWHRL